MSPAAASGWRYGLLGLPLAFLALPLYVALPAHYAGQHGVPLAALGALLLAVRLLDAVLDPALGRCADHGLDRGRLGAWLALAALAVVLGFAGLFHPPAGVPLLPWAGAMLVLAYLGHSLLGVSHQAWGARLGGDALRQTRLAAWREGWALAGVLIASLAVGQQAWGAAVLLLALGLAAGLRTLHAVPPPRVPAAHALVTPRSTPWATPGFAPLLGVYALNGIAGAIPATLLLFFVQDRLQAAPWQAAFLGLYFVAAALALPLWVRAVARWGLERAWQLGMLLAVLGFVGAAGLQAGDVAAFALVCGLTGLAAGADLAIPGALLTRLVQRQGLHGAAEGRFFGWWTATTKLNLALAAGLALPLLQALGYRPGQSDADGLHALAAVYALLPCALKLAACALLEGLRRHPPRFALPEPCP